MGIPRFYKWLKNRYPLIRLDLSDKNKQLPIIDQFYIDFNALVYQCIRESNCFLRNKLKPLSFEQIYQRVFDYLIGLIQTVNPQDFIYIALDGVAPRAKINQSRDRRFKGSKDDESFQRTIAQIGIQNKQNFLQNSISPGTQFLNNLCQNLKARILKEMEQNWKHLKLIFSDCCTPGQGEHKIMEFLRYTRDNKIFSQKTTYCVYSPDADVILLTLSLGIENICLIKEDTSVNPSPNWTATTVYRKAEPKQFEFVMINLLREYFEKQFSQILKEIKGSTIQQILDDLILLMAFVGNDFLPLEFCFTLKDNHIENLFVSYKTYLIQNKQFINKRGKIDWHNIYKLLQIGKRFEAQMIQQMINKKRQKNQSRRIVEDVVDGPSKQRGNGDDINPNAQQNQQNAGIQCFQISNHSITKGKDKYYETRFGIIDIKSDKKYKQIIEAYVEGLEFYCEYYFTGLPSWSWYYPFHYTPLLTDVYEYLQHSNKANFVFEPSEPFEPILALFFMVSLKSLELLPKPIQQLIHDQTSELRSPIDYFPTNFELDKFETLKYNKRALIEFLKENQVRKVYSSIPKQKFSQSELQRNQRKRPLFIYNSAKYPKLIEVEVNQIWIPGTGNLSEDQNLNSKQTISTLQAAFKDQNKKKQAITRVRFPSLKTWWGADFELCDGGKILTKNKYVYNGNPGQIVWFNNFLGMIEDQDNTNQQLKRSIQQQYQMSGIAGKCDFYFTIKRVNFTRQVNRFALMPTKKQVIVPDFAATKPPAFDYIKRTENVPSLEQYQKGEIVSILTAKHFGYQGVIEKLQEKTAQVRLIKAPVTCEDRIEALEDDFYTVEYVLNHLHIKYETLIAIMDEIMILPQFNKKKQPQSELLPTALNFSLNIIDVNQQLLVPRFVRCQTEDYSLNKPFDIFKKMQISKLCLENLEKYVHKFDWLVEFIQNEVQNKRYRFHQQIYARVIFREFENPNLKMYKEFVKLYDFENEGSFYSVYSKVYNKVPQFKEGILPANEKDRLITVRHYEMISVRQALKAPPALKYQPEYHNIGDKVILLSTLETGYVVCIDDSIIHARIGLKQKHYRVKFDKLFNQHWSGFLSTEEGKGWNLQVSYYTPTYWKKVIDVQKPIKQVKKQGQVINEHNEKDWQDVEGDQQ